MRTEVIAASAGTGKTFRLAAELKRELLRDTDPVSPERVIAVTFTRAAAAELQARVRRALLDEGEVLLAHRLAAARIGTIHSVCAHVVREHAFALGLSPELMTLDERLAEHALKNALEQQISEDERAILEELDRRFGGLSWHNTARRIIDAVRENGGEVDLDECVRRSLGEILAALPAPRSDESAAELERDLVLAIEAVVAGPEPRFDSARDELQELRELLRTVKRGERVPWWRWARLGDAQKTPWVALHRFGVDHVDHPHLRADLELAVRTVFAIAARAMRGYADEKRSWGVFDFVDQEAYALALLRNPDVRPRLQEQIGLVLVDEFQDTSPLQLAILTELSALAEKSVFVGDQKQAIFGFRGADPRLMEAVIDAIATTSAPLDVSYRSRPALVSLTSSLFAPAFAAQGVPAERVRVTAKLDVEPAGLGAIVERWKLSDPKQQAQQIAAGVAELLEDAAACVRARDGAVKHVDKSDVAILTRTNRHAREIADALATIGIPAVLRRRGLASSVEVRALMAGLALFHDGRDALAAAELARVTRGANDPNAWLSSLVTAAAGEAFVDDAYVAAVAKVAEKNRQVGVVLAVDLVVEALRLREVCASWGDTAQRLANLGAVRALAVRFVEERIATGAGATIVGFLARLDELADADDRDDNTDDEQGDVAGQDAVEVSTWHKAKGREWPVVVLAELLYGRPPSVCGVHVESDVAHVDVNEPLQGRWVRYWPHPYGDRFVDQRKGVLDVLARHPWQHAMDAAWKKEELRLLYVGWTRARDRIVLPSVIGENGGSARFELWSGGASVLRHLSDAGAAMLSEPDEVAPSMALTTNGIAARAKWAGHDVDVVVRTPKSRPQRERPIGERAMRAALPDGPRAPAFVAPSSVMENGVAGDVVSLGAPIVLARFVDEDTMALLGTALHGFFAADQTASERVRDAGARELRQQAGGADPLASAAAEAGVVASNARFRLAEKLLTSFTVRDLLQPDDLVVIADRLYGALAQRHPSTRRIKREAFVMHRLPSGTVVRGQMDLVLEVDAGFVIVDHKTYVTDEVSALASTFAGQLRAYASALSAATSRPVIETLVHLPLSGVLVPVR
jgi:ATP-dependent exoDNAse (exonuclease V) beta subunit